MQNKNERFRFQDFGGGIGTGGDNGRCKIATYLLADL